MNEENIKQQFRILFNKLLKNAKIDAKLDYCFYCEKKITSFCNSHTIPKFVLKNVSKTGMIYNSNHYLPLGKENLIDEENGVNNAGIFRLICRNCDSKLFQDYENIQNIKLEPTNKMMAEIALKNIFHEIYKKNFETQFQKKLCELYSNNYNVTESAKSYILVNELNLNELKHDAKRFKTIIEKNLKSGLKLIFWHKCNYIVPIAFQGPICLYCDLNGRIINNIYDYSPTNFMQYIHICVFPLESESIIMVFRHKDDTQYKGFEKQFAKLSLEQKLNLISYIIVEYSDDFFVSKEAKEELINNSNMENTTLDNTNILSFSQEEFEAKCDIRKTALKNYIDFPNILSENWQKK